MKQLRKITSMKEKPVLCIDLQRVFLSEVWFETEEDFVSIRTLIQSNHPSLVLIKRN
jgi:hypothetical protein